MCIICVIILFLCSWINMFAIKFLLVWQIVSEPMLKISKKVKGYKTYEIKIKKIWIESGIDCSYVRMWYKCIMERWKIDLKFAPRKWNSNTHFTLTVNKIPNTMPTSVSQPFPFLKSQRLNVAKLSASLYFLLILRYLPSVMGDCEASLDVEATRHALRYTVPAILVLDAWWPSVKYTWCWKFPIFCVCASKDGVPCAPFEGCNSPMPPALSDRTHTHATAPYYQWNIS